MVMTLDWDGFCSCNHSPRRCAQQKAIAKQGQKRLNTIQLGQMGCFKIESLALQGFE